MQIKKKEKKVRDPRVRRRTMQWSAVAGSLGYIGLGQLFPNKHFT
jgi:hypothetical protein